jgi:choline dehydrogenase-like flavoprotein
MVDAADFAARVRTNQEGLLGDLKCSYEFIVCSSGSSDPVVARRLAEIPSASVLLIEAGGSDDVPAVLDAALALENLGSERDWAFPTRANPHLNGRALLCSMGKVLGGGSSINFMAWSRVPAAVEDRLANGVGPQKAFGYGAFIPREGVWI